MTINIIFSLFAGVDDCQGISCNNGTCQDGLNSYNCSCDAGYKGDTCDTGIVT